MSKGTVDRVGEKIFDGLALSYPNALPDRLWIRDRLLWADGVSAIWPTHQPDRRTKAEELTLSELDLLREAGLFSESQVPFADDAAVQAGLEAALGLSGAEQRRFLDRVKERPGAFVEKFKADGRVDPNLRFYINKFPPSALETLLAHKVVRPAKDGHFVKVSSNAGARKLMSALADFARPVDARPVWHDPETDVAFATSAAPTDGAASRPAAVVKAQLPVVAPGRLVPIEALIEFRSKDRNEQRRQDYLGEVRRYAAKATDRHEGRDPSKVALERIERDLEKAVRGLQLSWKVVVDVAFDVADAVLPLLYAADDPKTAAQSFTKLGKIAAVNVIQLRENRAPAYLRSARREGLLPDA
ncbi:unannotated protein [freshwater metagenome]|uniref:Unannotated protein n=1 Tax=freshwater metagenome TaxID=449393 RepID=A0A6J7KKE3_9ZZZZ|nr:hypothetical protein [Actinomycetota bacterium]